MDTTEDVPRPSFSQLLDRGLALPPARAHWCPSMDLLAVLTSDGQLQLYRLNWQRLWSITPESPITSLCWRPDGKQIAVGQHDGCVLLLNTEDGETQEQSKIFANPVDAITWTFSSSKTAPGQPIVSYADRTRKFFEAPLPPAPAHTTPTSAGFDNYAERLGKREEASWPPKLDVMDLIACGSSMGEIALCGEGLILLAKHRIFASKTIHQMSIPPSLAEIAIRWITEAGDEVLSLIDISFLAGPAQHTLRMLCSYAADITRSMRTCRSIAWQMWEEWQSVQIAMNGFKSTLNQLLKQHGVESDAQSDLLLLVTMGEYTPPMEQFLMNALGEAGLKKIGRGVDAALCAMHALLVDRLQPEMEMVLFRLSELRGMAANPMNRKLLKLHVSEIAKAENSAMDMISLLEILRERVTQGVSQYRTFFSWLTTALRRFPEDTVDTMMGYPLSHVDAVRSFLHYEFSSSLIEPLLISSIDDETVSPINSEMYSPEKKPLVDVFNPNIALDASGGNDYDFWGDEIKSNVTYGQHLLKILEAQFEKEAVLEKDDITESEEAQQSNKIVGLGALHRIIELQESIQKALLRPAAAMSTRLYPTQDIPEETSHWMFVRQGEHDSGNVLPSTTTTSTSTTGVSIINQISPSSSSSLNTVVPGVLQYANDTGELTVALTVEVPTSTGNGKEKCLAFMTVSKKIFSEDSIYLESRIQQKYELENKTAGNIAAAAAGVTTANIYREVKFTVMPFPDGHDIVDIGYYKDGALALLLENQHRQHQASGGGGGGGGGGNDVILALAPRDLITNTMQLVNITLLNNIFPAFEAYGNHIAAPLDLQGCRQRELPYRNAKRPMAISSTRGIAFVLTGNQRAILYDLEEDEEEVDEEGEEGEGEEEEQQAHEEGQGEDVGMADVVVEKPKIEANQPIEFIFRPPSQQPQHHHHHQPPPPILEASESESSDEEPEPEPEPEPRRAARRSSRHQR